VVCPGSTSVASFVGRSLLCRRVQALDISRAWRFGRTSPGAVLSSSLESQKLHGFGVEFGESPKVVQYGELAPQRAYSWFFSRLPSTGSGQGRQLQGRAHRQPGPVQGSAGASRVHERTPVRFLFNKLGNVPLRCEELPPEARLPEAGLAIAGQAMYLLTEEAL